MDKSDIDKLKNIPSNLNNLKSKVDKLNVDKLVSVPVDLSKLSDLVKNDFVKKNVYNAKIKTIKENIPGITNLATNAPLSAKINEVKNEISSTTNLATNTSLNAKLNEVKREILSVTNLATTAPLTSVENKIPKVSDLVKKANYDAEIKDIQDKYFTTSHYN